MKPTIIDYDPQELVPPEPEPDPALTIKNYLLEAEQRMASTGVYTGTLGGGAGPLTIRPAVHSPPSDLAVLNASISELTSHIAGLNSLISLLIKDLNRKP